jgi:deoxycytidylate deaminase
MHKFLKYAVQEAQKSDFRQLMGAIIYDKNRIISYGYNTAQRSVKHLLQKYQRWPYSVHAEVAAIINSKTNIKGMNMLVVRVNTKNQLRYARPCDHCLSYINYVKIKKVYFSLDEYPYIDCINL